MTRVEELKPGDVVEPGGPVGEAVFIARVWPHPYFGPGFHLVIWRLSDDTLSLDCLVPEQEVGAVIRRTRHDLRKALGIGPRT